MSLLVLDSEDLDSSECLINSNDASPQDVNSQFNPFHPNMRQSMESPMPSQFQSLHVKGRLSSKSLSPLNVNPINLNRNPFTSMHSDVIPGPVSLRCNNVQFITSWVKYIFQGAISVICHSITFTIMLLWIRFLYTSYYDYIYHHNVTNHPSTHQESIISFLPFSSWLWITLCLTNIVFFLGFTVQILIIPIQWNFEDNSNATIFRLCCMIYTVTIIVCIICSYILQFQHAVFYSVENVVLVSLVMLVSFMLLFVAIKNGEKSNKLASPHDIDLSSVPSSQNSSPIKQNKKVHKSHNKSKLDLNSNDENHKKSIYIITQNRITTFSKNYSCSKLIIICIIFSLIITSLMSYLYFNFSFVFSFILNKNNQQNINSFLIRLSVVLFGSLFCGDLLVLIMKILMKWLFVLLLDTYIGKQRQSISWSFHLNYGAIQPLNRMILFAIPLMFISKITTFIMLYTFCDGIEFASAVTACCVLSRCFNQLFMLIERKVYQKLNHDEDASYDEDEQSLSNLQDHQLSAQCNYIHDIILYIATLLVPVMFGLFGVNLNTDNTSFTPRFHYLQTALIQFIIQSIFDILPLLIILIINPISNTTANSYGNLYHLAKRSPLFGISESNQNQSSSIISKLATDLKIQYINMMNAWTATDKCVRHFMWWCTIFIGGFFTFYFFYPQQFLCGMKQTQESVVSTDWVYIRCQ